VAARHASFPIFLFGCVALLRQIRDQSRMGFDIELKAALLHPRCRGDGLRRCINELSLRIGGPNPEARAFQVIATLERGMMLARAYQDTEAFDRAVAGLV
jgi:hypothetical protein